METIELSGYTHEEKREIAKRYLVPRQMERNGLGKSKIEITEPALDSIIDGYTREAGVRNLEREIGSDLPQGGARVRGGIAPLEARDQAGDGRRAARQAALPGRGQAAHQRARRRDRAGVDAGGR